MFTLKSLRIGLLSIVLIALLVIEFIDYQNPNTDIKNTSVTVTNMIKTSGGSGVVVGLLPNESEILTNFHVCDVIKDSGGYIHTVEGSFIISSYLQDMLHDLCIIKINVRLKKYVEISNTSPKMFDELTVVGHPKLLPTIINKGHLSQRQEINVLFSLKPCKEDDIKNNPLMCILLGGIPIIRKFEANASSLLTQPGSSGSGVFDKDNRLTNLVFAGSGDMAFGFLVPFEYVSAFYNTHGMDKSKNLFKKISYTKTLNELIEEDSKRQNLKQSLVEKCLINKENALKETCKVILQTINWRIL